MKKTKSDFKKFKLSKWIVLSIAFLLNSFIIAYSCFSDDVTKAMERPLANFFTQLINTITHKNIENIPLENIAIGFSNQQSYTYNYIPGYKVDEIPLGSAKQIECTFYPTDATDKSIKYSANPEDNVLLTQSGSALLVVGMKTGECVISAKSNDGALIASTTVNVVDIVAPVSFEVSLEKYEIPIGETQTINFDIDGGVLTHDELINFRYYDIKRLDYASSNKSVAIVEDGVVYPKNEGTATIHVSSGTCSKSFDVIITSGSPKPLYSDLSISGSGLCYENDMIADQRTNKNHYQLTPKDGNKELDPNDFIWSSFNELLVRVDRHGVMRGFRKIGLNDETTTIFAKSKTTGQTASFQVTVRNRLPMYMDIYINVGGKRFWNQKEFTLSVGENIEVKVNYDVTNANNTTSVLSEDESIISFTNEGDRIVLHILKEGVCNVKIFSNANPELSIETKYTIVTAGSISAKDTKNVEYSIRKIIGHAMLFGLTQIFTYISFYMFLYDKKWWFYSSLSLGEGLLLAGLSELIQFFVPTRSAAWLDILIDFGGVLVGAILTFLTILLIKKIKAKKYHHKIN